MFLPALVLLPLLAAPSPERVELVFGGDIIPHGWVKKAAADHALRDSGDAGPARSLNNEGWDHILEPVAPVLRAADLAVVNLETPISGDPKARAVELIFDAPKALPHALAAAGVDVVTIANNHAYDQRRVGIQRTWEHVDVAGLRRIGSEGSEAAAWEPLLLETKGMRLGFLSFTRWLNGATNPDLPDAAPHVAYVPYIKNAKPNDLNDAAATELVRAAARRCDALIVAIHWGTEYTHTPHPEDRTLSRALLEAGAIAIVGHHPHVLQPVEAYRTTTGRDTLVAFSLGNLVANQDFDYVHHRGSLAGKKGRKRDSMLLRLALGRAQPGAAVTLEGADVLPVWIDNIRPRATQARKEPRRLQALLLDEELQTLLTRLEALPARAPREPRELRQERAALELRMDLVRRRRELILQITQPTGPLVLTGKPEAHAGPTAE